MLLKNSAKVALLLAPLLFSTLSAFAADEDPNVVATINGKKLSKEEFDRRYKESIQMFKFTPPTKASVLNDIVNFELAVQEARKEHLENDPVVRERLESVLYQSLVEKQLSDKFKSVANVSEDEARSYCKKNPEVHTSHVYVMLRPSHTKAEEREAYAKINAAEKALASGKAFDKVVADYSSKESFVKDSGGDIGFQGKDKLDPTYYAEARKLSPGEYSKKPVKSQFGLHIIKLLGTKECSKASIPDYQRLVFDEKRAKIFSDYLNSLRSDAKVSINEKLIQE
jgi:peptidyl-prolyl cis-trans isomerase C